MVLSGNHTEPSNFTSRGHQLYLRWSTDHATSRKGFRIRYAGECLGPGAAVGGCLCSARHENLDTRHLSPFFKDKPFTSLQVIQWEVALVTPLRTPGKITVPRVPS